MAEKITRQVSRSLQNKGRRAVTKLAESLKTLSVEYVPIADIHPNEYNPNRQSPREYELLLRSMEEDGFTQPILVQRGTQRIVDGEHRWRAAHDLGYTEVPVVYVDMSPEQMRISTLRHNRARGSEDLDAVANVLRDLEQLGALDKAMDSLMLDERTVEMLLEDVTAPMALANEDYVAAWEPSSQNDQGVGEVNSELRMTMMSTGAAERHEKVEEQLQVVTDQEERTKIMGQDRQWGLTLVVSAEQGMRLRDWLGDDPCAKVLEIVALEEGEEETGEE